MVIKGSSRGQSARDCRRLADHLLNAEDNESVEVVEIRNAVADSLQEAFAEWRAVSLGSRTKRCLYHASINVAREETAAMDAPRWREAADELGRRMGMGGHPRAVVRHCKQGREHIHVVWLRVDPNTLKAASDSGNYRIHEETSRELERRFALRPVVGAHTRMRGTERPVAFATHADQQAAERTGMSVAEVSSAIRAAWMESSDGSGFAASLSRRGLCLALGRRGIVAVDQNGTPHSLSRRLGMKAGEVHRRLEGIDEAGLPTVEDAKRVQQGGRRMKKETNKCGAAAKGDNGKPDLDAVERWWKERGFAPVVQWDSVVVDAFGGTWFDFGDRIEIQCVGEPTDEQVRAMVEAGLDRGWDGFHFYGGSASFQKRARDMAIQMGVPADRISLECEAGSPPLKATEEAMPDHLKRSLGINDGSDERNGLEKPNEHEAEGPRL